MSKERLPAVRALVIPVGIALAAASAPAAASDPGLGVFALLGLAYLAVFLLAYSLIWAISLAMPGRWRWLTRALAVAAFFAPGYVWGEWMPAGLALAIPLRELPQGLVPWLASAFSLVALALLLWWLALRCFETKRPARDS